MLQGYGLLKQTADTEQALQYCIDWLSDSAAKEKCLAARERLLADKIDVTEYIVTTIESYL
jgi:predicted glycosyltransferase